MLIAVAFMFALMVIASHLLAQNAPPASGDSSITFYGAIQSAADGVIVINGQIIDTRSAEIDAALVPGAVVRVVVESSASTTLIAQHINAVQVGVIPGIVRLTGVVTNISERVIVLDGTQIVTVSPDEALPRVGERVRLFVIAAAPGRWTTLDEAVAPLATPEARPPAATAEPIVPPAATPEVAPPASTPDVDDSHQNRGGDGQRGGDDNDDDDNSGRGGGDN
jgi:hypothetical protein